MLCFLGNRLYNSLYHTPLYILIRALTCMVSTDVRETVGDRENRDCFNQAVSRRHFLTKSDINNVRVKVNDEMIKRHKDDSISVTMMVSELKEEPFNPILVFKPQGSQDPGFPTLSAETFVLAIQTQFQMELYRRYATTILCIDSTHGTNQYRFKLITCIVRDDHGKGWRAHTEGNVCQGYL